MPGVPPDAFQLLEQSFKDAHITSNGLKTHKQLPHQRHGVPASKQVPTTFLEMTDYSNDSTASEKSMHEGFDDQTTPPPDPRLLIRHNSGLPPTPPTNSREDPKQILLSPSPLFADGVRNALHPRKSSGLSTPSNQQRPLTPDVTPPGTSESLMAPRPLLQHYPSSMAESFRTAREELSINGSTSQVHLPVEDTLPTHWLDTAHSTRAGNTALEDAQVFNGNDEESSDITPTRTRDGPSGDEHEKYVTYMNGDEESPKNNRSRDSEESMPTYREMDTSFLRNVTVRKGRRPRPSTPENIENIAPEAREARRVSCLREQGAYNEARIESPTTFEQTRNRSLRERVEEASQSPRTPEEDKFARDISWPDADNDMLYSHMREEKAKRLSAISDGSAVEAMIVATPPQRKRTLRHTSKCSSLRDTTSLENNEDGTPRLRHKRAQLPDRKTLLMGDERQRVVSAPELVAKQRIPHKLHRQSRPITALLNNENTPPRTALRKLEESPILEQSPGKQLRQSSAPTHMSVEASRITSLTSESLQSHDAATRPSTAEKSPVTGWHRQEQDRDLMSPSPKLQMQPRLRRFSDDDRLENNMAVRRSSLEHENASEGAELESPTSPRLKEHKLRHFSGEERLENNNNIKRTSLEHASPRMHNRELSLSSSPPKSIDRRSDYMNPRFLHASNTPLSVSQMSQMSERTEMEVCEARGVEIYPHNNNSLLVVQQPAKSAAQRQEPPNNHLGIADEEIVQPVFSAFVEPSSPQLGMLSKPAQVDSPLSNPRAAPQPPVIQFIPPTPAGEVDDPLVLAPLDGYPDTPTRSSRPAAPQRSLSLVQKARRYSESFVTPLFGRSASFRKTPRQAPSVSREEEQSNALHPFWRPRGFWDDFSDSEGEDDDYEEPLPRGGDTSDVAEESNERRWSPRKMSVRMRGFRGNGGFLVGNSLGLDRHGTNNRRHHVSLPANSLRGGRTSSTLPESSYPAGVRKRASEEMLKTLSSRESLRRAASISTRRKTFSVPVMGVQVQYVGLRGFRERMRVVREAKEERERQKRCDRLRGQIGMRMYHVSEGVMNGN